MALGGDGRHVVSDIEVVAEDLAESIYKCNPDKHGGRGRKHSSDDVEMAFKSAVHQLQTTDFEEEWRIQEWNKYLFEKWNGSLRKNPLQVLRPVPAAILMPVDGLDDLRLVMPDRQGNVIIKELNTRAKKAMAEVMPRPTADVARPGILGYRTKTRPTKKWFLGPSEA